MRISGGIGMLLALTTLLVLRTATGLLSLLDALAEVSLEIMPMGVFSALLGLFQSNAKAALLGGLIFALTILGGLTGPLLRPTTGRHWLSLTRAVRTTTLVSAVGIGFLYWAVALRDSAGFTNRDLVVAMLCIVAGGIVYGFGTPLIGRLLSTPARSASGEPRRIGRRQAAGAIAGVLALIPLSLLGREVERTRRGGLINERRGDGISSPITSNADFYTISSNFLDPTGDGGPDWRLTVDGMVDRPLSLQLADLQTLADPAAAVTLNCISNEIGGPLIGTAMWDAAPLARVLAEASPQPGVVDVVFHGRDGYTDSIPLATALAPAARLAWTMNGEPLPSRHGAPLRALVPGIYGIKSVKWLERIELVAQDHQGYWQQRDWTDDGTIKPISRFDVPIDRGMRSAGPIEIGGIAWAGLPGVARVEVSTDDGETWLPAEITARPGDYSWVVWRLNWTATPGTYDLVVPLIDGTGTIQPDDGDSPLPDGASGWHRITVGVI